MELKPLKVSEIFYAPQGEGARAGVPSIFIRLQGCKAQGSCYAMGIKCDTEFESGKEMTFSQINEWILENAYQCKNIIWTGGEPATQLTREIVEAFKSRGMFQSIETSGLFPIPDNLDYIVVSPKAAEHVIAKNFTKVDELRYVRHRGQDIPKPKVEADYYYISPHSDGNQLNSGNLKHCINLILKYPTWRISIQQHKIWRTL